MGMLLSFPVMEKHCESGSNGRFIYSITQMQGWREDMEDAHAAVLDLDGPEESNAFFAVYDGHNARSVADFAAENVHKRLITEESYKEGNFEVAFKKTFLRIDEAIAPKRREVGCTAAVALVTTDNKIYVANAGDSRSVISVKGEAKPLSVDHKPTNEVEKARIEGAGGYVQNGRTNGNFSLSRAFGDFRYKENTSLLPEKQIMTADPDVTCHKITADDEFLVIACDGIWDCMSSQQVIDFVRYQVSKGKELTEIGDLLCDHCLAPDTDSTSTGMGTDNMTVLIVGITHGRSPEEWSERIRYRVANGYGFEAPGTPPRLYSESRLQAFQAKKAQNSEKTPKREDSESELGSPMY